MASLIQDWVNYWDSLVYVHKDPTGDVIGSSLTEWQVYEHGRCHKALWLPLYATERLLWSKSVFLSTSCAHSFQNVQCSNSESQGNFGFKNVGYTKSDINFNDSFRTCAIHTLLRTSNQASVLPFYTFLVHKFKFINEKLLHLIMLDMYAWDLGFL